MIYIEEICLLFEGIIPNYTNKLLEDTFILMLLHFDLNFLKSIGERMRSKE